MKPDPSYLKTLFDAQMAKYPEVGRRPARERIKFLKALKEALSGPFKQPIRDALQSDFGKPPLETDLTEIYPILAEIRHAEKHLADWMRPRKVSQPLTLLGARSRIRYESKGVCLILSPWNFPLNLTFGPLVSALAAGNCCILKPSEHTPATAAVMEEIVRTLFDPSEVALVQGEAETAAALLEIPFHHIFFTGSPRVGKIVMKAAAEHLSSITLELGGKSPAYVGRSADLKAAATRIAWGKSTNAGQICVAPDYLLVDRAVKDRLVQALRDQWKEFYPDGAGPSESFAQIVNDHHHARLVDLLDDGLQKGGKVLLGGGYDSGTCSMEPTLIEDLPEDARLMQEEIFGPILPVISVSGAQEALQEIQQRERPLSLYIYSRRKKEIRALLQGTRSGTVGINHNVVQYSNHHLPFGGVNNSGIGESHGYFGFLAFSNQRSEVRQYTPSGVDFLTPPYTKWKQKMVDFTLRWL